MKLFYRTMLFVVLTVLTFTTHAEGGSTLPQVKLETSMGDIVIELNEEKAPKSVANFLSYVEDGHYTGTVFHRVIEGFMIQGGGFDEEFAQKPTKAPIDNEANNGLSNKRGTLAMARTNDPHSATAQFFINVVDNNFLDFQSESGAAWGYAVFGEVVEGMDVIDEIRVVATGNRGFHQDVPNENVLIKSATVVE